MEFKDAVLALDASSEDELDFDQFEENMMDDPESFDDDPISEEELTYLFNAIMDGGDPPPRIRGIEPDTSPLTHDLRETMFDTLPEMDLILRNECIE